MVLRYNPDGDGVHLFDIVGGSATSLDNLIRGGLLTKEQVMDFISASYHPDDLLSKPEDTPTAGVFIYSST